jgi:hypothetical protein
MGSSVGRPAHGIVTRLGATVAVGLVGLVGLASLGVAVAASGPVGGAPRTGAVAPPATSGPSLTRPVVVLYGDSLAWEAQAEFVAAFADRPDAQIVTRTYGGSAICDFLHWMRTDARDLRPGAVVVEFSGNAFTPCMLDATGHALSGAAFHDRYRTDADAVVDIFAPVGTHIWFAGAPIARPDGGRHFNGGKIDGTYRALAEAHPGVVDFIDAGASVLDLGRWTATLPCRPDEPCEGGTDLSGQAVNVVRAPDGDHFCPASEDAKGGVTSSCPVWSSGAFRYGRAMAAPVLEAMGSEPITRP